MEIFHELGSLLVHLFPKRLLSASTENTLAFLVCDEKFFSELPREASEVAGCFSSRVRRLLHLHVAPGGIQRYMWKLHHCFTDDQQVMVQEGRLLLDYVTMNAIAIRKILKKYDKVHGSVTGRNFKTEMHDKRIELLQSPWLIELDTPFDFFVTSPFVYVCLLAGFLLRGEVPNLKPASIQLCPHIARDWFYGEDKEHSIKVVVPGLSDCGQLR
ncbi:uncharacterized protein A4U43_C08F30930 [Asparagus officinalis]|nr:uncharacterized protein A4U43_C08F30930 [Asparagus officinalis]